MYPYINIFIIMVFGGLLLFGNKDKVIKFKVSDYLSKLSPSEKKNLLPYLKGVLIIGLLAPALVWLVVDIFGDMLLRKIYPPHEGLYQAYQYIGWCFVDHNCRNQLPNNQIKTNDDVISIARQIHMYKVKINIESVTQGLQAGTSEISELVI